MAVEPVTRTLNLTVRIISSAGVAGAFLRFQEVGALEGTYRAVDLYRFHGDDLDGYYLGLAPAQSEPGFVYYYFEAYSVVGGHTLAPNGGVRYVMRIVPWGEMFDPMEGYP